MDDEGFEDQVDLPGESPKESSDDTEESEQVEGEEPTEEAVEPTEDPRIAELTATIAIKDGELEAKNQEINRWKAKNFDLLMQMPNNESQEPVTNSGEDDPEPIDESTGASSLFEKKE